MSERVKTWERAGVLVAAVALVAGATACSATVEGSAQPKSGATIVTPTPKNPPYVTMVPNFSKLRKDGLCMGGDPRPCFLPIRKVPDTRIPATEKNIFNRINGVDEVQWPFEAHGASRGDDVEVVCEVTGKSQVIDSEGGKSDTYDVVRVSRDNMSASAIAEAENAKNPPYGVIKDEVGMLTAVYGYAADMWLAERSGSDDPSRLAPCTAAQNPAGYPTF